MPVVIKELDVIVLTVDLPEHGLRGGDVGTVVFVHGGGAAFEVEFCTMTGRTVAVVTAERAQVRPIAAGDLPHARALAG